MHMQMHFYHCRKYLKFLGLFFLLRNSIWPIRYLIYSNQCICQEYVYYLTSIWNDNIVLYIYIFMLIYRIHTNIVILIFTIFI